MRYKIETKEELEMWQMLDRAAQRRDLFWIFYYADQLSTLYCQKRAGSLLPVIK